MATDDRDPPVPPHDPPTGPDAGTLLDVHLTVIEYGAVAAEYAAAATHPDAPRAIVDDYAIVVDALALARRVPTEDVPAVLAVGTRALLRVHRALLG
ncbi:hypothetical protein [Streptomyces vietnamensis]|uniref:hypothetical protein n=1 Tax=Streptomyces vietnamensis TaxID=362257 RepID=UPI000B14C2FB|nr:hypothetical protein [Streptomyces vietnamensis]